jgi:hypothetical protein
LPYKGRQRYRASDDIEVLVFRGGLTRYSCFFFEGPFRAVTTQLRRCLRLWLIGKYPSATILDAELGAGLLKGLFDLVPSLTFLRSRFCSFAAYDFCGKRAF